MGSSLSKKTVAPSTDEFKKWELVFRGFCDEHEENLSKLEQVLSTSKLSTKYGVSQRIDMKAAQARQQMMRQSGLSDDVTFDEHSLQSHRQHALDILSALKNTTIPPQFSSQRRVCRASRGQMYWDVSLDEVKKLAKKASRVCIQTAGNPFEAVISKEGAYPIQDICQGRPIGYNRSLSQEDVCKFWEVTDPKLLDCLRHSRYPSHELNSLTQGWYWACCNGGGLHICHGRNRWQWTGSDVDLELCLVFDGSDSTAFYELADKYRSLLCRARRLSNTGTAYIDAIERLDDRAISERWAQACINPPEYHEAARQICVDPAWMVDTKLLRYLRSTSEQVDANQLSMQSVLLKAIQKAYGVSESSARTQRDLLTGKCIFNQVENVYQQLEAWKQPHFKHALKVLANNEDDPGAIVATLGNVCERSMHCKQVALTGFNVLASHTFHVLSCKGSCSVDLEAFDDALIRFYDVFEHFLDDFKEQAYRSSFVEPLRFYFRLTHDSHVNEIDSHITNWYLALLSSTLGVQLPRMPVYWDDWDAGTVSFWEALTDECWEHFVKHFGAHFESVPELNQGGRLDAAKTFLKSRVPKKECPVGNKVGRAKNFANAAVDVGTDPEIRRKLAVYIERFAFFFRTDFFVRKAFEVPYSEMKPEHAGFRKACDTLFAQYRAEKGILDDSLVEYVYADDMYMELDVRKTSRFFQWLGILKPDEQTEVPDDDVAEETEAAPSDEHPVSPKNARVGVVKSLMSLPSGLWHA